MIYDVKEIVKTKLGSLEVDDTVIDLAIEEARVAIVEFCHFPDGTALPNGLIFTHANMAIDIIKYQYYASGAAYEEGTATTPGEPVGGISSINIGDTSLNFDAGGGTSTSDALKAHTNNLDELVMNYFEQLKSYRRLKR